MKAPKMPFLINWFEACFEVVGPESVFCLLQCCVYEGGGRMVFRERFRLQWGVEFSVRMLEKTFFL